MVQKMGSYFDLALSRENLILNRMKKVRFLSIPFSISIPKPCNLKIHKIEYVSIAPVPESFEQILQCIASLVNFG